MTLSILKGGTMLRGSFGPDCFGPDEIRAMRRALELAERALSCDRALPRRSLAEQRQQLAKSIIERAQAGLTDPVILSAAAVGAIQTLAQDDGRAVFRPRGPRARRAPRRPTGSTG